MNGVALPSILPDDLTLIDACAGFGMLGEAVLLGLEALGLRGRVVCHIERDSGAAAALVARMEKTAVDRAPVFDDLCTFDGRAWRGCVDIFAAGLPCQPYSLAGRRLGNADHRSHGEDNAGPVPHALRIIKECRPALVFFENVPAWVVGGHFRSVGEELCRMGYTLQSPIFLSASDVGASQERERVFILACSERLPWRERLARRRSDQRTPADGAGAGFRHQMDGMPGGGFGELWQPSGGDRQSVGREQELAGGGGARREGTERRGALRNEGSAPRGSTGQRRGSLGSPGHVPDSTEQIDQSGSEARRRASAVDDSGTGPAGERIPVDRADSAESGAGIEGVEGVEGETGRGRRGSPDTGDRLPYFPPGRGDESDPDHPDWWAWSAVAGVEPALMPRVEPELSMVADGLAFSRSDLLRIGGNGVVTLAAAYAFAALLDEAINRRNE